MSKSWVVFASLPLVAACAGSMPHAQMAEKQCTNVQQDSIESHIKVKSECTSPSEGSSVDPLHHPDTKAAPQ